VGAQTRKRTTLNVAKHEVPGDRSRGPGALEGVRDVRRELQDAIAALRGLWNRSDGHFLRQQVVAIHRVASSFLK
jgi:hypothetical protein